MILYSLSILESITKTADVLALMIIGGFLIMGVLVAVRRDVAHTNQIIQAMITITAMVITFYFVERPPD